jgi:predicted lipid-binding transport protein (Tim44 family)
VLTYAAVSLAAIPIYISIYAKERKTHQPVQVTQSNTDAQQPAEPPPAQHRGGMAGAILKLGLIGLASPFLDLASDPFHGLIGLVILFVGLKIAWQITAGSELQISGPFENAVPAT